jgi:hypothetical protein
MSINAPTFMPSFRKDLQPADNNDVARAYRGEFQYSQEALLKVIADHPSTYKELQNLLDKINRRHAVKVGMRPTNREAKVALNPYIPDVLVL